MKKSFALLFVFLLFPTVLICGCKKEKAESKAEETAAVKVQEEWTKECLLEFLKSAKSWKMNDSNLLDSYKADGTFISINEGKGEPAVGRWNVVSPVSVEIEYNTGNIEKLTVTGITSDSFVWSNGRTRDNVSRAVDSKISAGLKEKIKLFKKVDPETVVESGGTGEKYYVYPDKIEKCVCTDDGSSLNYREEPVDGTKLGKFENGTRLYISKRTFEKYTVDGLTDHWYYAVSYADIEPFGGWVFGGYLKDSLSEESDDDNESTVDLGLLIGSWEDENKIVEITDDRFSFGLKEGEGFCGKWSLKSGNRLLVEDIQIYDEGPQSVEYEIIECSEDSLVLVRTDYNWKFELSRKDK